MSLRNNHDVQKLRNLSLNWIARKLAIEDYELQQWVDSGDDRFHPSRYHECSGKRRLLDVPLRKDKLRFRKLNNALQYLQLHHRCAHGGIRGCSTFTSAKRHLGASCIATTDVKDCFPSVTLGKFEFELTQLHLKPGLSQFLSKLLLCRDRIPQGCPTSNIALNIFFWKFDHWLESRCAKKGLVYSRVADDIVISGNCESTTMDCAYAVHERLQSMGLTVSENKWFEKGMQFSIPEMLVHSLNVNGEAIKVSSEHREKILSLIALITGACKSIQLISFLACVRYRQKLHGWSNYVSQSGDSISSQIKSTAKACDQMVLNRLKKDGVRHHNVWWHPSHAVAIRYAWNDLVGQMFEAVSDDEVDACNPLASG